MYRIRHAGLFSAISADALFQSMTGYGARDSGRGYCLSTCNSANRTKSALIRAEHEWPDKYDRKTRSRVEQTATWYIDCGARWTDNEGRRPDSHEKRMPKKQMTCASDREAKTRAPAALVIFVRRTHTWWGLPHNTHVCMQCTDQQMVEIELYSGVNMFVD